MVMCKVKIITDKQLKYLRDYLDGMTVRAIAEKHGVNKSTVSRTIHRATDLECPFGSRCEKCVLSECALSEEAAGIIEASQARHLDLRKRSELVKRLEPSYGKIGGKK